ncbi:hypothetical protein [Pandoravirus japonicus]|uniref:Transmembrane protein n=1 Tax=Pandoravirus japonicus TaxID=2823154 RepID=A0A811BN90_9VIRU|nr:hypothetical protein [Pandoravirus japonicus]
MGPREEEKRGGDDAKRPLIERGKKEGGKGKDSQKTCPHDHFFAPTTAIGGLPFFFLSFFSLPSDRMLLTCRSRWRPNVAPSFFSFVAVFFSLWLVRGPSFFSCVRRIDRHAERGATIAARQMAYEKEGLCDRASF